jgi:hypothetical protein
MGLNSPPPHDLTAERAAIKLYEKILSYSPDPEALNAGDDKDFEAIMQALKTVRQEALREGGAMEGHMGWTKNAPKEVGWYWWRDEYETRVVEVYVTYTGELNASGENFDLWDLTKGEWQGPITPES